MKEQLITFETSKLAHSKGFTRELIGYSLTTTKRNYYNNEGILNGDCTGFIIEAIENGVKKAKRKYVLYPACSQSLLQKWLREEYKMYVSVVTDIITLKCDYEILVFSNNFGDTQVFENEYNSIKWDLTYEQALEKGLQEALKLIK